MARPQAAARKDMPDRFDGMLDDGMVVVDRDPDREYVLVYRGDQQTFGRYTMMGYELERHREGGPRLAIHGDFDQAKAGTEIECMGHVLMSIAKDVLAKRRKFGGHGFGMGTAPWDQIEKRLKGPGQRGIGSVDRIEGTRGGVSVLPLEGE